MKTFKEWLENKSSKINENHQEILQDSDVNKDLDLKALTKLEKSLTAHSLEIESTEWQNLYKTFLDYVANPALHENARNLGKLLSNAATTGDMDCLKSIQESK